MGREVFFYLIIAAFVTFIFYTFLRAAKWTLWKNAQESELKDKAEEIKIKKEYAKKAKKIIDEVVKNDKK